MRGLVVSCVVLSGSLVVNGSSREPSFSVAELKWIAPVIIGRCLLVIILNSFEYILGILAAQLCLPLHVALGSLWVQEGAR